MQTETQATRTFTRLDENGRITKGVEYANGARVEIPVNKDGLIKWFDDSKLLKKKEA